MKWPVVYSADMSEEERAKERKKAEIIELCFKTGDPLFCRFFDPNSEEMLDEKIEVLNALVAGKPSGEIPNYYKVQEFHPYNHPEDYPRRPDGLPRWDW